ncbi:golgin subfamily A member 1-like [Physella acuta]|uniref:golgin subfamily A member 1-like n=1 Tax=Physella acuta TaxID=109671 RepID=UPI0027DC62FB|nr:golgin subfamily A member 1-like [Physella acuta]
MFAKLKKKIENEGGAILNSDSPGKSRRDSVTSLPHAGSFQHLGPSPPGSIASEDSSMRDVMNPRDELTILLQRKSEQCKKLEGNISDLAALIKDKSKTIDKLEQTIKQHEEATNKKLQEQKEEFEKYRDKLIEGYQSDKLKLEKDKSELSRQLVAAEQYKARYFKREEENDEFEGLTTQELAKVKHLLLNTEEILVTCRADLETKTRQCHAAESQVEKLTDEIGPLRQRLTVLEADNLKLKEENGERAELVISLSKDKSAFEKRLDELNKEMLEKDTQVSKLQEQLSDLDGEYKTLIRNSDLQRNKTSKMVQEKDDQIDTLQERVKLLEQRISDSGLSGDDRLTALSAERDSMEQKLSEARQQLTEVKSTWSDKISHLEDQISHLNAKIVEDSEELTNYQKMTEQIKTSFHKQVEDLRSKLEEAENRALENLELASSKASHYEKQIVELEMESAKQKQGAEENENLLRAKIGSLESLVSELEAAKQKLQEEMNSKIAHYEEKIASQSATEAALQSEINQLKEEVDKLMAVISGKDSEIQSLQKQQAETETTAAEQNNVISSLKQQLVDKEHELKQVEKNKEDLEQNWQAAENAKGDLLDRNAELHKQIHSIKSSSSDTILELERSLELKSKAMESMEKSERSLRQRLEALEKQIELNEIMKAESGLYSNRIEEMNDTIASLQSQLAEKNRTVKKQEQTLKDLRTTLQREFKVQSLPNDEGLDQTGNNTSSTSPSLSRRIDSYQQQQFYQQNSHQPNSTRNSSYNSPSAAVLAVQSSSNTMTLTSSSSSVPCGATDALTVHTTNVKRDLDKDVNFLYLKHVVLKFMLSRESEAIQLIKAVSMLLNFTIQEQQLIKDTLEWKMSWFGHRPPLGKGQTSKVIPPTL